ncbi:phosphoribosylanthranilate isomerase [Metabacillus fastidiosus]|uniref:phosphoribosylanthranilate isomerase n=1 Tax=Metabacillus fastidiosus TaxID=1458 RepID=UPI002E24ECD1|nr:phosphoribosylanthranilate isomerase [Metabacillus fastidiosus]
MVKPLLKYCGIRSYSDLQTVASSQADYLGFIFADSKRKVDSKEVKEWLQKVNINGKKIVAVFVNATIEQIETVYQDIKMDVVQFHGDEPISEMNEIKNKLNVEIWKALHQHSETEEEMISYHNIADGFVVDSKVKGQRGGTGVTFDWTVVPKFTEIAKRYNNKLFIAGGVKPDNIEKLLDYHPIGIDLSSGIELDEQKNKEMINELEERMLNYVRIS